MSSAWKSACFGVMLAAFGCGGSTGTESPGDAGSDGSTPLGGTCGGLLGQACGTGAYCAYAQQSCGGGDVLGTCKAKPEVCPLVSSPVCGCNQKTYGNECEAAMDGVNVASMGTCVCKPGEKKVEGCNDCVCDGGEWVCTRLACPQCKPGETKTADDGCNSCVCSDRGYWSCTTVACPPPGGTVCGAWAGNTCKDDEYCAYRAGQHCGAADASATCQPRPTACADVYAPVCGCDQKTYSNVCTAASSGTGVYAAGSCTMSK